MLQKKAFIITFLLLVTLKSFSRNKPALANNSSLSLAINKDFVCYVETSPGRVVDLSSSICSQNNENEILVNDTMTDEFWLVFFNHASVDDFNIASSLGPELVVGTGRRICRYRRENYSNNAILQVLRKDFSQTSDSFWMKVMVATESAFCTEYF